MLLLRVECLAGNVATAVQAGDSATATRLTVEMMAAIKEAKEMSERMRAL